MNSLWSHNFQENKTILLPFKLLFVTQSKLHTNKKLLSLCNLLHTPLSTKFSLWFELFSLLKLNLYQLNNQADTEYVHSGFRDRDYLNGVDPTKQVSYFCSFIP